MVVLIQFLGSQRNITQTPTIEMPITNDTKVSDVLEFVKHHFPQLHLQESEALITINQEMALPDQIVNDKDTISFLPFIHGG
jgi:molybdopterin converting factor small subunit